VLVPVSVKDKSGKHVAGLKQDVFNLRQDGREQKISVFEELSTNMKPAERPKLPAGVFTNTMADAQQRRLVIIALDTINTAFSDQHYAREHLIKYLSDSVEPDALLCLVTVSRGGIKLVHDFTTDPKLLVAALHKVKGMPGMNEAVSANDPTLDMMQNDPMFQSEVAALNAFVNANTEMQRNDWRMQVLATLDAMNQLSQAFAGVPGKKALLWATGSFPFMFTDPNEAQNGPQFQEILPEYERTWQLLNNANIAVYPVDVRGLVNATLPPASTHLSTRNLHNFPQTASNQHYQSIAAMQTVADMTGGRAFFNSNDLERGFRRAAEDAESYYLLGYYRDPNDAKPGWRKLRVDVHAPEHVEVRARSGFYVAKAAKHPDDVRKTDMRLAMVSPLEYTGIPLLLEWTDLPSTQNAAGKDAKGSADAKTRQDEPEVKPDKNAAKKKVHFALVLPASGVEIDGDDANHMNFEVLGIVTDHEGKPITDIGQTVSAHLKPDTLKQVTTSGITYRNAFELPPGDYTARLIVRDAISGRIGTVITPLKVQ
jgi:VWFA-related protein